MNRQTASDLADVIRALGPPDHRVKVARATVTKSPSDGRGVFTAIVSTFGPPPDSQGDIISPGAYDRTIREAYGKRSGRQGQYLWPLFYAHDRIDATAAIGGVTAATVSAKGLVIEGRLELDTSTQAMTVYELLLKDIIREFSIGYAVVEEHVGPYGGGDKAATWLDEVELLEVSVVYAGANRFTQLVDIKSESDLDRYKRLIADAVPPTPDERRQKQIEEAREQLVREVRAEREGREHLRELARINSDRAARMANGPSLAEELAEDGERYAREVEAMRGRDAERAAEAEERERVDEANRRDALDRYGRV